MVIVASGYGTYMLLRITDLDINSKMEPFGSPCARPSSKSLSHAVTTRDSVITRQQQERGWCGWAFKKYNVHVHIHKQLYLRACLCVCVCMCVCLCVCVHVHIAAQARCKLCNAALGTQSGQPNWLE